jgi:hypothetical protein
MTRGCEAHMSSLFRGQSYRISVLRNATYVFRAPGVCAASQCSTDLSARASVESSIVEEQARGLTQPSCDGFVHAFSD